MFAIWGPWYFFWHQTSSSTKPLKKVWAKEAPSKFSWASVNFLAFLRHKTTGIIFSVSPRMPIQTGRSFSPLSTQRECHGENFQWQDQENWAMLKKGPWFFRDIGILFGDHKLLSYVGIIINTYNDPYKTTSTGFFFRGPIGWERNLHGDLEAPTEATFRGNYSIPIELMCGIFTYVSQKNQPNVGTVNMPAPWILCDTILSGIWA